jgi:cysteine desulfurase/selenocysteine lyase
MRDLRKDFVILGRKINNQSMVYLDNAATSQKPRQVIEAIKDFYEQHNANVHRGTHILGKEAELMLLEAEKKIAGFIGGDKSEELIQVRNATEGLNLIAVRWGLEKLKKGDRILISEIEHDANREPWEWLAKKIGIVVKQIPVNDEGRIQLDRLDDLLDERVKLIAVSGKSNVLGTIQPIKELARKTKRFDKEIKVVIDGAHLVPHVSVNVRSLGIDALVFSGHKMLGPMGIGIVWNKDRWIGEFELGTPNVAGMVGLGVAVEYLEEIGMGKIYDWEVELTEYLLSRIQCVPGVKVYGPKEAGERSGVVGFNLNGIHADEVAAGLDGLGIVVRSGQHCAGMLAKRLGISAMVRVSLYFYNTKEEIDRLIEGLLKVKKLLLL